MKNVIKEYLIMTIGCILLAASIAVILIPNRIGTGGVTGIATSLNALIGVKVGIAIIAINVPLFFVSYKLIGINFTMKTGFLVVLSSFLIDFLGKFNVPSLNDMFLSALLCGILMGAGYGLIFMAGGSTGGTDILAKAIKKKFPQIPLSRILLSQDILVYILVGYVFGIKSILYALVMSFARGKTMDIVQEGISSSKQCIIICENHKKVLKEIQFKLSRGVTIVDATGGYLNNEKKLLYVVVQNRELNNLRRIIKEVEPSAFMTVSSVTEILGKYRQNNII
ncbi:YitT family protein [Clostridium oceanicum]|uniref:YitT family protein n=1 Tax=Clostridium oceanicum TaxID=1543 RepID=A0ABP3V5A5_9CLOT